MHREWAYRHFFLNPFRWAGHCGNRRSIRSIAGRLRTDPSSSGNIACHCLNSGSCKMSVLRKQGQWRQSPRESQLVGFSEAVIA